MFAVQAEGQNVDTVEGLAAEDGQLCTLQQAFRHHHALQCGFCTPGILMSLNAYLKAHRTPTEREVRAVLSGHLCRCTGYTGIVRAVMEVVSGGSRETGDGHV
jgi:2-furoyl-CoA dehydrogenase 2Fe-2S iron sulfur subunit